MCVSFAICTLRRRNGARMSVRTPASVRRHEVLLPHGEIRPLGHDDIDAVPAHATYANLQEERAAYLRMPRRSRPGIGR
jgi:hypothetical protein